MKYTITTNRNIQVRSLLAFEGETQTVSYDFTPWETDNGSVSAVVWTVKNGDASVANEALASGVASAEVTTGSSGQSMIKVTATAGNNVFVTHLMVYAKDPDVVTEDYGIVA